MFATAIFLVALWIIPTALSAVTAGLLAQRFEFGRRRLTIFLLAGGVLGLVMIPFGIVTVGTIGGGYWEAHSLPGGPLTGVVAAIAAGCVSVTAMAVSGTLLFLKVALVFASKWASVR